MSKDREALEHKLIIIVSKAHYMSVMLSLDEKRMLRSAMKEVVNLIESETAKAYAKGFNEGTLNPNKWLCPICKVILKSRVRELHESTHREGDAKETDGDV